MVGYTRVRAYRRENRLLFMKYDYIVLYSLFLERVSLQSYSQGYLFEITGFLYVRRSFFFFL